MLSLYPHSTPQESHLLQHYVHVVSRSLSVVPDEINTFISLFVPMALQQPAMRNALLGLSATHLKRIRPEYDDIAAVSFQQLALRQAQELLYAGNSTEGLAAVLFLCLQEVCEGKSQKWPLHLSAAVTIINTHGGPTSFPPAVRFLIEAVAYFDSIATLSFSKSAFLDQQFYLPTTAASLPAAHPLFGTAHELFATIAEISQLAQLQDIRYHSATAEANFLHLASDLELQLQSWMPTPCPPCPSDPNLPAKITAASVMLQWAALLRLHLIVATPGSSVGSVGGDGDLYHPKIRTAVRNILAAFETIPEGDLVESMLIFPVFAAGFAAVEEEERAYVRRRLGIMERSIGFGNVSDAKEAVERYWEEHPDGSGGGSWEGVVGEWGGGTLIMS
jgi:transcriptional activator protein UGA3